MGINEQVLHLRALEPSDLDFLYALENDRTLWTLSNTLVPFSAYTLKDYIAHSSQDIYSVKQQRFVLSNAQSTPLGCIDLYDFDPQHHRAGVGLVIDQAHRQKGYATTALQLIEAFAFDQLQLHQLYAGVGEDNLASIRLFQSAGYEQTGIKKDWNFYNKSFHNELIFQKIAHV